MKKKIVILIPVIVILGYVLYKGCLLLYFRDLNGYSIDYDKVTIEEKKINVDKSLANTKIEDINLYIPLEFTVDDDTRAGYYRYVFRNVVDDKDATSIIIAKGVVCYEVMLDENKVMQTIGYEKLMQKNNMNSERDLIKYYYTQRKNKNIFTSSNDIKLYYLSEKCAKNSTINGDDKDSNYFFSGDLDGTLYKVNNRSYSIKIYNESKREYYWISIYNYPNELDEVVITDEEFNKILQSIYFD